MDRRIQEQPARRRRRRLVAALPADLRALADELSRRIEGEVRFDPGSRALYATDSSNYREVPLGVVVPRSKEDVLETIELCRRHRVPVLPRGGGTSLAGQCCNVAVVLEMSKYLKGVVELDPAARLARVLPGTVLDRLREAALPHDLTFGPDPATHDRCTLGGMIGNNSCGPHSVLAGRTADNLEELDVLTYDGLRLRVGATPPEALARIIAVGGPRGRIYAGLRDLVQQNADLIRARFPKIPRRSSGYALDELLPEKGFHVARALVGSEGTCVTVLEATLRLVPWPRARVLIVFGYPDVYSAGDHVPGMLREGIIAVEGLDDLLVDYMRRKGMHRGDERLLPPGKGWLLVEVGADSAEEARARAEALCRDVPAPSVMYTDPRVQKELWAVRESGLGATARVPGEPDTWEGWEDSAVPVARLGDYLRDLRRLFDLHGYHPALYGHFGQGCVHCRVPFDLTSKDGIRNYRSFVEEAADLVVSYGGSLSGEHGDGQSRAELLPRMYGPELMEAFRRFKAIWDPDWKMNPGKIVDAHRLDQDLRLGPDFRSPRLDTHFKYPDDDGDFTRATLRCVGVGECRREGGGTMCPSYMVTGEEKHSTRGRAHLLFEMMRGDELAGWRDEHIKEALDLCLACKGCKGECPVNVDVATYKAEFLAHYYEGRLRPRAAYAMGLIDIWARLGGVVPRLANLVTQTPGLAALAKAAAGIAPERKIPDFAPRSFRALLAGRRARNPDGEPVILWADTFNNHFFPETAMAALEVLEAAGFRVHVPRAPLCCGRPLYDWGMLPRAKRLLARVLAELGPHLRRGVPVVGLEPSCLAVFRDEARGLLPADEDARRLAGQSHTFGQFLRDRGRDFELPRLGGRALVHGHCHHKSLWGMSDEALALDRLGVEHEVLDSGCCGMAGAFGFEKGERYEVSMRAGERVLLPAVRAARDDTIIVADGFSCREQIRQATPRRALHLAEVARMALDGRPAAVSERPEARWRRRRVALPSRAWLLVAAIGLAAMAAFSRVREEK